MAGRLGSRSAARAALGQDANRSRTVVMSRSGEAAPGQVVQNAAPPVLRAALADAEQAGQADDAEPIQTGGRRYKMLPVGPLW